MPGTKHNFGAIKIGKVIIPRGDMTDIERWRYAFYQYAKRHNWMVTVRKNSFGKLEAWRVK